MKNKSPLISVIMPAYNVEAYIGQAISSILNQTHKNLELIVIDDCSTDRTGAVAESYIKKDSRVRVFYNEKNSKEWFCRNLGIEKAKGDYIAWMDADDVAVRTRLVKQLQFLNKRRDVDIVGTYFQLIDETGEPIKNHVNHNFFRGMLTKPYTNDHGLYLATIPASYLFRRAILSQFKKPYHRPVVVGTDTDFVFRVMEKNILIYNLPEQLYYYRLHDGQSTNQRNLTFMIISLVRYAVDCRRR
ncbi:MAG: glycosyltransferase, partial [Hydrotalea sp.]|nr:glycosyltransferase [Hydrotalea sp.]